MQLRYPFPTVLYHIILLLLSIHSLDIESYLTLKEQPMTTIKLVSLAVWCYCWLGCYFCPLVFGTAPQTVPCRHTWRSRMISRRIINHHSNRCSNLCRWSLEKLRKLNRLSTLHYLFNQKLRGGDDTFVDDTINKGRHTIHLGSTDGSESGKEIGSNSGRSLFLMVYFSVESTNDSIHVPHISIT